MHVSCRFCLVVNEKIFVFIFSHVNVCNEHLRIFDSDECFNGVVRLSVFH